MNEERLSSSLHLQCIPREFTNRDISFDELFCDQLSIHTQFSSLNGQTNCLFSCVQLGYVPLDKRICKSKIIIFHFQSNLTNAGSFKSEKNWILAYTNMVADILRMGIVTLRALWVHSTAWKWPEFFPWELDYLNAFDSPAVYCWGSFRLEVCVCVLLVSPVCCLLSSLALS